MVSMISLSSCERAHKLADSLGKKAPEAGSLPANIGPLIVEIPDGGYEIFLKQKDRLVIVDFDAG